MFLRSEETDFRRSLVSGEERGLLSRTAAGNRAQETGILLPRHKQHRGVVLKNVTVLRLRVIFHLRTTEFEIRCS